MGRRRDALPIGAQARAGGAGRRAPRRSARGEARRAPGGRGAQRGARGLPGAPPPPCTQRGPGTPLPARDAEPAQACGLRSSRCRPGGALRRGCRGRRPACEGREGRTLAAGPPPPPSGPGRAAPRSHLDQAAAPARPPGGRHAKAMASRRSAVSAPRSHRGRGGGRPAAAAAGAAGEPTYFLPHPPPHPPSTHPEGFL